MKKIFVTVVFTCFLCIGLCQDNKLNNKLNAVAQSYESIYGFSGTIKVVMNDDSLFEKSYGMANRSFDIRNNPDLRFSINSISKTFTAAAILILTQDDKIDLHTPVETYLPYLNADWKDRVTTHHLLTHTSGLPRESGVQPSDEMTFNEQVLLIEKQELLFEPGDRYEYSNSGITLLGAILEEVSGQKYQDFIRQRILTPLKLKNTGYYAGRNVVEQLAVPYRFTSNGLEFAQRSKHFGDNAGGGLYSTPSDLFRFIKGLEENEVLSEKYTDLMFHSHIKSGETDYEGYAWSIKHFGDEKLYFAAGSGYGTKSVVIRMPDSKDFIGITSNWGNTPILQLLRDLFLTIRGQSVNLPSGNNLAKPGAFTDQLGTYIFDEQELTKHIGITQSEIKLQEFEGRLFLNDELLAGKDGILKLTYTDEMLIRFEDDQMIIEINGNIIKGKKQP